MTRHYLTTCAIAALLIAAPAAAQQQTEQPAPAAPTEAAPAAPTEGAPAAPAQETEVAPVAPAPETEAGTRPQLETVDGFVVGQSPDQIMGSNVLNVNVIGADGEQIGTVDDLLIDREGHVLGIIVGVGGFLGIGQRDVAIPIESVEFVLLTETQEGTPAAPAQPTDPAAAPVDPAAPAQPVPGQPAPGQPGGPGLGWGFWGGDGQLSHIQVDVTQAQLEAAPEFTRTTW